MAKRRNRSGQRDHSTIASTPIKLLPVSPTKFERLAILSLEDRRRFHPDGPFRLSSPRRDQRKVVERVVPRIARKAVSRNTRDGVSKFAFAVPRKVVVCVRRKQRREVLFAMRRTGKGAKRRIRRRNHWSEVSCK